MLTFFEVREDASTVDAGGSLDFGRHGRILSLIASVIRK